MAKLSFSKKTKPAATTAKKPAIKAKVSKTSKPVATKASTKTKVVKETKPKVAKKTVTARNVDLRNDKVTRDNKEIFRAEHIKNADPRRHYSKNDKPYKEFGPKSKVVDDKKLNKHDAKVSKDAFEVIKDELGGGWALTMDPVIGFDFRSIYNWERFVPIPDVIDLFCEWFGFKHHDVRPDLYKKGSKKLTIPEYLEKAQAKPKKAAAKSTAKKPVAKKTTTKATTEKAPAKKKLMVKKTTAAASTKAPAKKTKLSFKKK